MMAFFGGDRAFEFLAGQYRNWTGTARQQAMADAYNPILRGILLPGAVYYSLLSWRHWRNETGDNLPILVGISLVTALCYAGFLKFALPRGKTSLARLEAVGAGANLLMYSNVVVYLLLHFEQEALVYFVLTTVVFATSGVTLRTALTSVALSIATLLLFVRSGSPELFAEFAFVSIATAFVAFGMAALLRKAILRQIDARLRADRMAHQDPLTGIPNRRSIFAQIDVLVQARTPFWIGILDLDGFKSINDVYGHVTGDRLLCELVKRLAEVEPGRVSLGRIGGDEFAILVEGDVNSEDVGSLGDRMIAEISLPYNISPLQLSISGTVGFAHFPTMSSTARQIYEKADFALYRGKQFARRRTTIFTFKEDNEMRQRIELERGLREGNLESELYVVFQPQMNLIENRIVGFEALARWQSPTLGPVAPDLFIKAAERTGLIQKLTRVLFSKALDALETWPGDISMSFNLSAQDVADRAFMFSLASKVFLRGIDPGRVEFEITETAIMKDIVAASSVLSELSEVGFKIALDDFGSGYSSFEYIDQLPLNKIKIDKSFVRKVPHSAPSRAIVAGVLALCRNLDLQCVLEGVETEDELTILTPLSPQIIQGYLFGKPMNSTAVEQFLAQQSLTADGRKA
jgi:diguanylate cyclase (GGDEF)-like protein